jgi:rhodanese-related sulfurtransferase
MRLAPKLLIIAVAVITLPALMNAQCPGKCTGACLQTKADAFVKSVPEQMMYLMSMEKLAEMVDAGNKDLVILDIRPPLHYEKGHIKGSMHIPLPMLVEKMETIPDGKKVAVVCSMDTNSAFAVAILAMNGHDAWIAEGGISGWEKLGREFVK